MDFRIPAEQIADGRARVDQDFLRDTLFVIPHNDGEARRAVDILRALEAPHLRVSQQRWGATLEREGLSAALTEGRKRVVIFEIPSLNIERELQERGLEVVIIDHHAYQGLDRRRTESALEQLATLLQWPMSRTDLAIAVNDRSYIPGLKGMGLTTEDIHEIRTYDLIAQGNSLDHIINATRAALAQIPRLPVEAGVVIVNEAVVDEGILKQELAIRTADGIAHTLVLTSNRVSFSGDPKVTQALLDLDFEALGYERGSFAKYGGGDPSASMFFGFRPQRAPRKAATLIPHSILNRIRETVTQARLEGGHQ